MKNAHGISIPQTLAEAVRPDTTALIVYDMQVGILRQLPHGGDVLACSDMFFGPKHNLIMPGRAANMSDGWETKRRRGPGHDWTIIKLGAMGELRRLEIDTSHFKGNFPESCSLEASSAAEVPLETLQDPEFVWKPVLARTRLQAHTRHWFDELMEVGAVSHVRFNIFPDGGVSRLRVYGKLSD